MKLTGKWPSTPPPERDPGAGANDEFLGGGAELADIVRRVATITAQNERLFQRLIDGERRFRGLAKAVWKVQEEERRRLARELHDGLGQTLTALINQLRRLEQRGEPAEALGATIGLAEHALEDVRELSRLLRPPVLDDLGLRAGLNWLERIMRERAGLATSIDWQWNEERRLDPDIETLVFRVVQEALNNIVKHAGTGEADLTVKGTSRRLEIVIADAGRGFEPAQVLATTSGETGLGLRGIRDRVDLFGGRFLVESKPGEGSRLHVIIPITEVDR